MPPLSVPVIAVQVLEPVSPGEGGEQLREVVAMPGGELAGSRLDAPGNLRDAIRQASTAAASGDGSVGVFQAQSGAFSLVRLGCTDGDGIVPLRFERGPGVPIGSPYTERFERTPAGAGITDAPALQAIVGATTFATFLDGESADLQPLRGPVGIDA